MRGKRELLRKRPPILPFVLIFAAGFLAGTLFWHFRSSGASVPSGGTVTLPEGPAETDASSEPEIPPAPPQNEEPSAEPMPFVISFLGDCTLTSSHHTNHFEKLVGDDYAYPLSNVAEILLADDLTLANLECSFSPSRLESDSEYAFCGDPKYVQSLVLGGVEAVTMSNNHTRDFGDAGLRDTEAALAEYGVAGIPGNQGQCFELRHGNGDILRLGAYVHPFNGSAKQMEDGCKQLRDEGADIIVAFMHAGAEKTYVPTKRQSALAPGNVALWGFPEWVTFRGDSFDAICNLDATIYSRFLVDERDYRARDLKERYRSVYGVEMFDAVPTQGILGFDTGMFVVNGLRHKAETGAFPAEFSGIQNSLRLDWIGASDDAQTAGAETVPAQGGLINHLLFLIHYSPGGFVESETL